MTSWILGIAAKVTGILFLIAIGMTGGGKCKTAYLKKLKWKNLFPYIKKPK